MIFQPATGGVPYPGREPQRKSTKYDPTNNISARHLETVHSICTKFGMDILVDPRNKPAEEIFIFIKIQDGRRQPKIEFWQNFGSKITFRLGKQILFISFGQKQAWKCYLNVNTNLQKNFRFFSNFKMAAFCQKSNHKSHFGSSIGSCSSNWTKFGMNILLDHRKKPVVLFLFFLKSKMADVVQKLNFEKFCII